MTVVYVTEQGASLVKQNGRLRVCKQNVVQADVPLMQVEQIVAFGNVHLTTPMLAHCFAEKIDVCFLSAHGAYRGRLQPEGGRDVRLRQQQYRRCDEAAFALPLAQAVIAGKLHNQIIFARRRPDGAATEDAQRQAALLKRISATSDLDILRGLEGAAAAQHFGVLRRALRADLGFSGTRDRPARDPINALLNLGYTLLYNNVQSALFRVGLDPYLGCLHQAKHGHAALASDLMEEFRAVLVDSLIVMLVNHRELQVSDFTRTATGEARLTAAALRRFLSRFDQRLDTTVRYAPRAARFSYRQMFELQARHFARVLLAEEAAYVPYRWDW